MSPVVRWLDPKRLAQEKENIRVFGDAYRAGPDFVRSLIDEIERMAAVAERYKAVNAHLQQEVDRMRPILDAVRSARTL